MKTILKWCLPIFMLAVVSGLFSSCEGNDADDEGVITVKMRNANNGRTEIFLNDNAYVLYIESDNNFYFDRYSGARICDVGAKSLKAVKSVPKSGWTNKAAAISGHSYVIRCEINSDSSNKNYSYYKLHVVSSIEGTSGGILGYEVQYCEWNPK